jgi:benzoate/toluate 1,2-dioxygenase reductase subunit
MVEAVRAFFTEKRVTPSHFFYEKFSATEAVAA